MSPKNITLSIVVIVIALFLGVITHPFTKSQSQKELLTEIESAENYYNKARALALSMPLLPDTIVNIIADSLLVTLVTLNNEWVIFVLTEKGFEKYINGIEELNGSLAAVRMNYEHTKIIRSLTKSTNELEQLYEDLKNKGYEI